MSTTYPTTKQEFTNPTNTSKQNSPSHSTLHANMADTIEAIEDKLGTTGSLISGCGGLYPGSDSTTALKFCQADGSTSIMTIDTSNKRVGIKTTQTLVADLTVEGNGGENVYIYRYGNTANPPSIKFWKARGTVDTPSVLSAGDDTGKLEFWGYARNGADTSNAFVRTGYINSEVDSVDAQNRIKGKINFYIKTGYAEDNPDVIMLLDSTSLIMEKTATATAGTQYPSYNIKHTCSVWDTDNIQAEDRVMYWVLNAESGGDGSEPYYLSLYDNSDTELFRVDPLTPAILVSDYLLHLGDINTGWYFREDRITGYAGGVVWLDMHETTQDVLYIGNGALGVGGEDIDIYIGTNNAISIAGDTGWITFESRVVLSETGNQQIYSYEGSVVDEGTVDLPDSLAGFVKITFDEGAEWAICNITDAAVVTLIINTDNVDNTDTDTGDNYCIFDNGTTVRIKNYTGSEKNFKIVGFMG